MVSHAEKRIVLDRNRIAQFCPRHRIRKLSLFGSILHDNFHSSSDVDVLVEFEAGARVGLIRLAGIEAELSSLLGRKVDLRTPADLSRYFRDDVVASAEVLYVSVVQDRVCVTVMDGF